MKFRIGRTEIARMSAALVVMAGALAPLSAAHATAPPLSGVARASAPAAPAPGSETVRRGDWRITATGSREANRYTSELTGTNVVTGQTLHSSAVGTMVDATHLQVTATAARRSVVSVAAVDPLLLAACVAGCVQDAMTAHDDAQLFCDVSGFDPVVCGGAYAVAAKWAADQCDQTCSDLFSKFFCGATSSMFFRGDNEPIAGGSAQDEVEVHGSVGCDDSTKTYVVDRIQEQTTVYNTGGSSAADPPAVCYGTSFCADNSGNYLEVEAGAANQGDCYWAVTNYTAWVRNTVTGAGLQYPGTFVSPSICNGNADPGTTLCKRACASGAPPLAVLHRDLCARSGGAICPPPGRSPRQRLI
ncbi:MAG TPA: hypothetical protein VG245_02190 [Candidatus Dormibacteraeota bacterium]|jgi:hypothetical protein|nr:hypothetical protein [Candidatus Dormibacteraeota bacterium]